MELYLISYLRLRPSIERSTNYRHLRRLELNPLEKLFEEIILNTAYPHPMLQGSPAGTVTPLGWKSRSLVLYPLEQMFRSLHGSVVTLPKQCFWIECQDKLSMTRCGPRARVKFRRFKAHHVIDEWSCQKLNHDRES